MQLARMEWVEWMETCNPERLVFVDEADAKTNMTPLYGWSIKGKRCYGKAPCNWSTTTMLSSIRLDGTSEGIIFKGGVTKEIFKEYIEDVLLPALKPGDIIVMDNLRAHKAAFSWRKFKRRKVEIKQLPPYSPDFNPIEMMWSVVKNKLRRVSPQDDAAMWREVSLAHLDVTPEMAHSWFENIGYVH